MRAGGMLEFRGSDAGAGHYLDGVRLKSGDAVEVLLRDGVWLRGTYEWNGNHARWPGLRVELGGAWEADARLDRPPAAVLALHPEAIVRKRSLER